MLPEDSSAPIDSLSTAGSSANQGSGGPNASSSASLSPVEAEPSDPPPNRDGRTDPILTVLSVPEKVDIQLHGPPEPQSKAARWGKFLKDAGPIATGFFSLIVSFLVFYYGHQINQRQTEINEKQTELKQKELEVAQADLRVKQAELQEKKAELRQKVFAELDQPEETSQTRAAIRLAEYGEEILDPIRMALGVEQEKVQAGAVKVIFHIFRSETVPREKVFARLKEYMEARNPYLRRGALDCLIEICDELTADQKQQATDLLQNRLGPEAERTGEEDEKVVLEVAKFFGNCPSKNSVDFLLGVIRNCPYEDPRNQAALHLCKVVIGMPVEARDRAIANLEGLLKSGSVSGYLVLDIENSIKKIKEGRCL